VIFNPISPHSFSLHAYEIGPHIYFGMFSMLIFQSASHIPRMNDLVYSKWWSASYCPYRNWKFQVSVILK
jgi:hypothetical protein